MTKTQSIYVVVTAKSKAIGNGYDFKRKYYRYLASAVKYYFDHYNDGDNIYIKDELNGTFVMQKQRV